MAPQPLSFNPPTPHRHSHQSAPAPPPAYTHPNASPVAQMAENPWRAERLRGQPQGANQKSALRDGTVVQRLRRCLPGLRVQGSVDTKPFLQYDCDSNKVRPLGFLEVNDTKAWAELSQMLGEAGRELRMVLLVIKLDKKEMRGPPTLKVRLCCQREAEQCSGASLHFSLIGRTALLDTMSITWTVIDPGATGIKEEWGHNQKLAEYFRKISTGGCSYWLREFLEHWENMLLPEPTEPIIMAPDIGQSASIRLVTWIVLLIITQLVLTASLS
ncbi:retinoic acid early transcript 1E-like [Odocoileus virginianus]|uniref:Retinoic acid early transcript 1E-like n=1 Tax=Odocoileus virginianus TaxID=9874 RepID=A0ABM4HJR8_ODOVR